ncbi:hypothetical protein D3C80_1989930 [compost metagenome]
MISQIIFSMGYSRLSVRSGAMCSWAPRCSARASYSDCGVTSDTALPWARGAVTFSPQIKALIDS